MTSLRDPGRKYATFMVWKAVKKGALVRPESCSKCLKVPLPAKDGRARIQAHHHRGYEPEFILDVEWLCPSCHKIVHPNDAEALEKIHAPQRGRKRSAESIAKQKETVKGRSGLASGWTPERRAAQAERARRDQPWLGRADQSAS